MNNVLDAKVREKFNLFTGLRPADEDQKMYDKIMGMCFDEMIRFLSENLNEEQENSLVDELSKAGSDEDKQKIMTNYFSKVNNARSKFNIRIDLFLNNLLMKSIKNIQK